MQFKAQAHTARKSTRTARAAYVSYVRVYIDMDMEMNMDMDMLIDIDRDVCTYIHMYV